MWIRKGFSFKLTPDGAQARKMSRFAGCTRFVYNKGIAWNEEQRNADSNFRISYKALSAQLPIWKENHPWLADTYSQCLQQAMKDLSQGFQGSVSIFVSRVVFKGAANHGCPSCIWD